MIKKSSTAYLIKKTTEAKSEESSKATPKYKFIKYSKSIDEDDVSEDEGGDHTFFERFILS